MLLRKCLLVNNNCYKSGKKMTPKGIMVHSTGANNPKLSRYVQPNDGYIGKNPYQTDWNRPTPGGINVCVHAFIGKLEDGSIATYQTLPWDMVGWHSGSGSKGASASANNNGYIGFEICEDDLKDPIYFGKIYKETVELCVYLCKKYNFNEKKIICHSEGHKQGIASNHGDVMHWFPKFDKSMDTLRADVKKELNKGNTSNKPNVPNQSLYRVQVGAYGVKANATKLEAELKRKGYSPYVTLVNGIYKVQVGAFSVKANAESLVKKLRADGYQTYMV